MAAPVNPPSHTLGHANAVVTGTSRSYHVPDFEGCLSIKSVVAGSAAWRAGGRRFVVRENCFLVLNDRQHYTIDIDSARPTTTFCLFFARGFVEDIWRSTVLADEALLDAPHSSRDHPAAGFFERLEPASSPVLSRVRHLRRAVSRPDLDLQSWDEGFMAVATALVESQRAVVLAAAKLPARRAATKTELRRRLLRGRDLLLSSLDEPLRLHKVAAEACLSPYHFHRAFTQLFGRTPHRLLTDYRLEHASVQLRRSDRSILELCLDLGFQSPASFSSLFSRRYGMSPRAYRRQAKESLNDIRKIR